MNKSECNHLSTSVVEAKIARVREFFYLLDQADRIHIIGQGTDKTVQTDNAYPDTGAVTRSLRQFDRSRFEECMHTLNMTPNVSKAGMTPNELFCKTAFWSRPLARASQEDMFYDEQNRDNMMIGMQVRVSAHRTVVASKTVGKYAHAGTIMQRVKCGYILRPNPCRQCAILNREEECEHTIKRYIAHTTGLHKSWHVYTHEMLQINYEYPRKLSRPAFTTMHVGASVVINGANVRVNGAIHFVNWPNVTPIKCSGTIVSVVPSETMNTRGTVTLKHLDSDETTSFLNPDGIIEPLNPDTDLYSTRRVNVQAKKQQKHPVTGQQPTRNTPRRKNVKERKR